MRLLTHNFLQSNVKGYVRYGFHLFRWLVGLFVCLMLPRTNHNNNILFYFSTPNGYPLIIEATCVTIEQQQSPGVAADTQMVLKLLPKIRYDALVQAVHQVRQTLLLQQEQNQKETTTPTPSTTKDETTNPENVSSPPPPAPLPESLPPSLAKLLTTTLPPEPEPQTQQEPPQEGEAATTTTTTQVVEPLMGNDSAQDELVVLQQLHHVLFNIHIEEGHLICPDTGRKFPIKQGIPNMILHEDEV
jgi:uncharacterized protein YbaR (Trm112 family)